MKKWYQSKTIWFNVIMTVMDAFALASDMKIGGEQLAIYLVFLHGLGAIIIRIWFTNQPIGV